MGRSGHNGDGEVERPTPSNVASAFVAGRSGGIVTQAAVASSLTQQDTLCRDGWKVFAAAGLSWVQTLNGAP